MGIQFTKIQALFNLRRVQQTKVLMLGSRYTGKTTILYRLALNEFIDTIPTVGFNVEELTPIPGITLTVWDVKGENGLRLLTKHYYPNTDALIYVMDSANPKEFEEAKLFLHEIARDQHTKDVPFLILANKQDLPEAKSTETIIEALSLELLMQDWVLQPCSAYSGDGLEQGIRKLAQKLLRIKKEKRNSSSLFFSMNPFSCLTLRQCC